MPDGSRAERLAWYRARLAELERALDIANERVGMADRGMDAATERADRMAPVVEDARDVAALRNHNGHLMHPALAQSVRALGDAERGPAPKAVRAVAYLRKHYPDRVTESMAAEAICLVDPEYLALDDTGLEVDGGKPESLLEAVRARGESAVVDEMIAAVEDDGDLEGETDE